MTWHDTNMCFDEHSEKMKGTLPSFVCANYLSQGHRVNTILAWPGNDIKDIRRCWRTRRFRAILCMISVRFPTALRCIRRQNFKTIESRRRLFTLQVPRAFWLHVIAIVIVSLFVGFSESLLRVRDSGDTDSETAVRSAVRAERLKKKSRQHGVSDGNNSFVWNSVFQIYVRYLTRPKCNKYTRSYVLKGHVFISCHSARYRGRRAFLRSKTHHDSGLKTNPSCHVTRILTL